MSTHAHTAASAEATTRSQAAPRLFFTSCGQTCLIDAEGAGLRVLELQAPDQVTWQPCGLLDDGRVLLLSMEARRDGPGRPFDEYYHQTPTHVWAFDLDRGQLEELACRERLAPFYTPQLLLQQGRVLMQVIRRRPGQTYNMRLDGTDAREFTAADEGLPYGFSLSPDGSRVAFHLASPAGYQIWTCDTLGRDRTLVAAHADRALHIRDGLLIVIGALSLLTTRVDVREDNNFTWAPIVEVALLFIGIFITMLPCLLILKAGPNGAMAFLINAVNQPAHYFWAAGALSAFLDNVTTMLLLTPVTLEIAVVLGVSPDGISSHQKFKAKYQLPFPLLADTEHTVAEAYGAWGEKSMYGRKYMGTLRKTFLIDEKGKIVKIFDKVKVGEHADEVLKAFGEK